MHKSFQKPKKDVYESHMGLLMLSQTSGRIQKAKRENDEQKD